MSTRFSGRKIWLAIEIALIFIGIPILLTEQSRIVHPSMIVLPLLILLILALRKQPDFKLKDLIKLNIPKQDWLKHLGLVALAWLSLLAYTWLVEPENVFNLPKKNLRVWLIIITLYPLFSAYGQEVIFRLFMHLRYRPLLGDRHVFIIASATLFSFAHIITIARCRLSSLSLPAFTSRGYICALAACCLLVSCTAYSEMPCLRWV